jgi:type 1 glutamine amidotransferase
MQSTIPAYLAAAFLCLIPTGVLAADKSPAPNKKVVFMAGKKSHGPGAHEYEKDVTLLKQCLDTATNLKGIVTEAHFGGWPADAKTLDSADTIVLLSDGLDKPYPAEQHPFLKDDHLAVIERQVQRGCGLVLVHWPLWVPATVGNEKFLPWLGGFCDYDNPPGPGMSDGVDWAKQAVHPICRGVKPFAIQDEYYGNVRFLASDPRFTPILPFPGKSKEPLWAWAWDRGPGGRSFCFIGGHFHDNWLKEDFRKPILNAIVWTAGVEVPGDGVQSSVAVGETQPAAAQPATTPSAAATQAAPKPIRALLLTGHHQDACHPWRKTTPALQEVLYQDVRFRVGVVTDTDRALSTLRPGDYDLLLDNYCNWECAGLSEAARAGFTKFVAEGGGLAIIHFANGAFGPGAHAPSPADNWSEYNKLCRRVWIDGKAGHDAYGPFHVEITPASHPITQGMKAFDTEDELYFNQQGDEPIEPLAVARSKTTGKDEPLAFAYAYGKGRVFQTLLGHDVKAILNPGAAELARRGCVWAAGQ